MQFDHTFVTFFGFILFEPLIAFSNLILLVCALYYFNQLWKYKQRFSRQFALFILFTGTTGIFGTFAHGVHFQWGDGFFRSMLFLMNFSSLLSVLYCFLGVYTYMTLEFGAAKHVVLFAWLWLTVLMLYTLVYNEFLMVKVHIGIVSFFTLIVFSMNRLKNDPGSRQIVFAILLAILSVLVHTLQIRLHKWFNHKDMAHLFMLISLYLFFRGADLNSRHITQRSLSGDEV